MGNQTAGCHPRPGTCPDGSLCDGNADCLPRRGSATYACRCRVGWAGDGRLCGTDRDLDGWPDASLPCGHRWVRGGERQRACIAQEKWALKQPNQEELGSSDYGRLPLERIKETGDTYKPQPVQKGVFGRLAIAGACLLHVNRNTAGLPKVASRACCTCVRRCRLTLYVALVGLRY